MVSLKDLERTYHLYTVVEKWHGYSGHHRGQEHRKPLSEKLHGVWHKESVAEEEKQGISREIVAALDEGDKHDRFRYAAERGKVDDQYFPDRRYGFRTYIIFILRTI